MRPIPHTQGLAACAGPEHLALVDAAFERPGSAAGQWMRTRLCPTCPIARQCFEQAMTNGEAGIWGGPSPKQRTRSGAPSPRIHPPRTG